MPFWDWSLVSADPFNSDFWNKTYGFAGNGIKVPPCVEAGLFGTVNNWKTPDGGCLQRNFITDSGVIPDVVAVSQTLARNETEFLDFELMLRVNLHDVVHFAIGGTMIGIYSAVAPEFFPIHAFVDKIWDEWQRKGDKYRIQQLFTTQKTLMPGTNYSSAQFLDSSMMPGRVRVKYLQPNLDIWNKRIKDLKVLAGITFPL